MDEAINVGRLPYNSEAEQSVLGCVLMDVDCLITVAENLQSEDFYLPQNKLVYEAMLSLWNRGEPVDGVTVSKELGSNLEVIGSYNYLAGLAEIVPTTQNLLSYIKIVKDKAMLRRLINAANEIAKLGYSGDDDVASILDTSEKYIYDLLQNRNIQGLSHVKDVLVQAFANIEETAKNHGRASGVPSGFTDLDKVTNGFHKSELIIIAARPAMGKTSFALNIGQNAAIKYNVPTAVFSLEMSKEQLGSRIIWSESLVSGEKIRSGELADDDWMAIADSVGRISKAPLYIDDTPGITITDMRAKCRKLQLEKGLGLIIIDYLQLMQGSRRNENRQQEISEISRSLKVLSKELNVPVIALSQLSRAAATRTDHKPQLSDLRESGAIEQDADIVIFLHRPDYYDPTTDKKNVAECIIAKHRNGPVCTVDLGWNGEFTRFMNITNKFE